MKSRKTCFYALLILLVIISCFAFAEVALRIYSKSSSATIFSSDKLIRSRGKPHARVLGHKLNSKGFMDVEYPYKKPEGTYRIVAIGDSFAFGTVPYPENFLTILEEKMNATGKRFEIVNMGIPGTEPPEYLRLLKQEGLSYNPDMVMVFFFIGNDIILFLEKNMTPKEPKIYTARLIKYSYTVLRNMYIASDSPDSLDREAVYRNRERHLILKLTNSEKYLSMFDQEAMPNAKWVDMARVNRQISKAFSSNFEKLVNIKEVCDENGVQLLIVLVPEDVQVHNDLMLYLMVYYQRQGEVEGKNKQHIVDFEIPNELLSINLKARNIQYIDLLRPFRSYHDTTKKRLYIENNDHWNKEGNRHAADILHRELTKHRDIINFMK